MKFTALFDLAAFNAWASEALYRVSLPPDDEVPAPFSLEGDTLTYDGSTATRIVP